MGREKRKGTQPVGGTKNSCFDPLLVVLPQSYSAFLRFFLLFQFPSPLLLRSRRHGSQVLPLLLGEWWQGQPAFGRGRGSCRPDPVARGGPEADRGRRASEATDRVETACGFLRHFQRIHASPTDHRRVYYTNTKLVQGATMTRGGREDDAACADRSSVLSRMPRTSRSIATLLEAPRGTTTSAWRFVGKTNSSNAGLTNCS